MATLRSLLGWLMAACRDDAVPEILDGIQEVLPVRLPDHLAKDLAEQPDVAAHRGWRSPALGVPAVGGLAAGVCGHGDSVGEPGIGAAGRRQDHAGTVGLILIWCEVQ